MHLFLPRRLRRPAKLRRRGWGFAWFLLVWAAGVFGAEEAVDAGPPEREPVRTIHEFRGLPEEARRGPLPFRIECDVTFYDPAWGSLWLQDETAGAYVLTGGREFAMSTGQRVVVSGVSAPPNRELSLANAVVEVLGPATVPPVRITDDVDQSLRYSDRLVEVDALVENQTATDAAHLHLELSVAGKATFAWVRLEPGKPAPRLIDTWVRLRGVYNPKVTTNGNLSALEIMAGRADYLTVTGALATDQRFNLPRLTIASLANSPASALVRVVGQVKGQAPGRYLRVRDATGQLEIETGQKRPCAINAWVEAVGYPRVAGTTWHLAGATYRFLRDQPPTDAAGEATEDTPVLRIAAQVAELTPEEALRKYPVALSGVVTWSHPEAPFFFIQDSSGGVCIQRGADPSKVRPPGRNVAVTGTTALGEFAPEVVATATEKLGDLVLPEAQPVSYEQARDGNVEAQWVEMRGYLRRATTGGLWSALEIATPAGDFTAFVPASAAAQELEGAVVRLQGVCKARADERRKLTGVQLWVPSLANVQVEEPAPADPFAVRRYSLASLGRFGTGHSQFRRVLVEGVVLHHVPGYLVHLADGADTLLVLTRERLPLAPGDRVEAVGFAGWQGGRTTLREARMRKVGRAGEPAPVALDQPGGPAVELDGRLVRLQGQLVNRTQVGEQLQLTLRSGETVVEATLATPAEPGPPPTWRTGSELSLVGLYELTFDEYRQPRAFRLVLRAPGDVSVLHAPPWWTARRILAFTGALALGTVLAVGWVFALRRRVRRQTEQIREQIEREAHLTAELQRASKLESLGLLAGGIAHDFNNLLTVVMGNLSLLGLGAPLDAEQTASLEAADKAVVRARDLTQQLLTFSKGGSPIRAAVALADVVREVAGFALHGSKVRCEYVVAPELWPADVDEGQIGQVVQNLVLNAVQAMPGGGRVRIGLANETVSDPPTGLLAPGRYVRLTIADEGSGIAPADLGRIFDPYFSTKHHGNGLGLATVYSIVKKHGGQITVDSRVGVGTTFWIWLPAADRAPTVATEAPPPPQALAGRILFMDDEPDIRRLGAMMLERLGATVTPVADGAEAVREYRRARDEGAPYDLVILDLTVPGGMGGKQAMEELLRLDPGVRAIVSSGYSNDQVLSNYRAHGFRGMVSKPYEIDDMVHAIDVVLRGGIA